jgi:ribonuclease VapC
VVIDTSAIIAILFEEPDGDAFILKIKAAENCLISAATLVELAVVLRRQADIRDDRAIVDFLEIAPFHVVPFDAEQSALARDAYRRYGQGSGHPARLNFGDCVSYALAKQTGAPLLFKGTDFAQTDVAIA